MNKDNKIKKNIYNTLKDFLINNDKDDPDHGLFLAEEDIKILTDAILDVIKEKK